MGSPPTLYSRTQRALALCYLADQHLHLLHAARVFLPILPTHPLQHLKYIPQPLQESVPGVLLDAPGLRGAHLQQLVQILDLRNDIGVPRAEERVEFRCVVWQSREEKVRFTQGRFVEEVADTFMEEPVELAVVVAVEVAVEVDEGALEGWCSCKAR